MRRSSSGLTLVELAVAAAIAALMMGALYASISTAFSTWRRFQRGSSIDGAIALDRLCTQFSNAPAFSKVPFEAGGSRVAFAGLVNVASPGDPPQWSLGQVVYEYDSSADGFCVTERPYKDSGQFDSASRSRCLVSEVKEVRFEYARIDQENKEVVWSSDWEPPEDGTRKHPDGLRVYLVLEPRQGSQEVTLVQSAVHPAP